MSNRKMFESITFWKVVLYGTPVLAGIIILIAQMRINNLEARSKETTSGETKKFQNETLDHLEKLNKKKDENKEQKNSISVKNVTGDVVISQNQTGGITAHTVNLYNSNEYIQPNHLLLSQVDNNLNSLINEFPVRPTIVIEVESGNSHRHQVACELEKIIQKFNLGSYPKGNLHTGKCPDDPITVIGNKNNIPFFQKFTRAINPYLTAGWQYKQADTFPDDYLKIYINGTPSFSNNGSVKISH